MDIENIARFIAEVTALPGVPTTFTVTLTGCTATITGTASWERHGNLVTLLIPALTLRGLVTLVSWHAPVPAQSPDQLVK